MSHLLIMIALIVCSMPSCTGWSTLYSTRYPANRPRWFTRNLKRPGLLIPILKRKRKQKSSINRMIKTTT